MKFEKLQEELYKELVVDIIKQNKKTPNPLNKKELELLLDSGIISDFERMTNKILLILYNTFKETRAEDTLGEIVPFLENYYPVLKSWKGQLIKNYTTSIRQILDRLSLDFKDLKVSNILSNKISLESISSINLGMGDTHWEGRAVSLIEFNNGEKLMYKPRSFAMDKFFVSIVTEIYPEGSLYLGVPHFLGRDNYGWCQFIEYKECDNISEVKNYYYNLGFLLSILYALEATDFHYENIICYGEQPMLIDLESFFHPYFSIEGTETNQGLDRSVLRTGLLPYIFNKDREHIDISGVSDVSTVKSFFASNVIDTEEGEIAIKKVISNLTEGKNIPRLKGEKKNINSFKDDFLCGFENGYKQILVNKNLIENLISNVGNCFVRVLFRNTAAYSHLLQEAYHPTILKSEEALNKHLDWLDRVIPEYKIISNIVEVEKKQLRKREIPFFLSRVNSKHLWYSENEYLSDFFMENGIQTVLKKINSLSIEDLNEQKWYIKKSLNIVDFIKHPNLQIPLVFTKNKKPIKERIEEQIKRIYQFITDNIFISNKDIKWLIYKPASLDSTKYAIYPASYDLYSGMPGEVILFFLIEKFLNINTNNIAEKSYLSLMNLIERVSDSIRTLGQYAGWGSIITLNNYLYDITKEQSFLKNNEHLYRRIDFKGLINVDNNLSLIKGTVGFISASIDFYKRSNYDTALKLSKYASDYLIKNSIKLTNDQIGWKIFSDYPLSGLAHGASGFAFAFMKLYMITKDSKYYNILRKSLTYETHMIFPTPTSMKI